MNPYMMQDLATARDRDLRKQAVAARRASRARRGSTAGQPAGISCRESGTAGQPAGI